jgi:hypothetical protein
MHPSSGMGRAACAATCLVFLSFMPVTAEATGAMGGGHMGGFRLAPPAAAGFHSAPRAIVARPQMQRLAPQGLGRPNGGYPGFAQRNFGYQRPGMPPMGGPIYGHVRTGPQPYPHVFPGYGQSRPGFAQFDHNRGRRFAGGPLIYPFGGYGAGSYAPQVEPSLVTQYAEPPLQGYYGYYGGPAPTPCVAPIIIQIGPTAGGAGRLLPPVVQGGGSGGCGVPQVVTYARADAPPQVIEGLGPAPRGKRKHALRARY